MCDPLHGAWQGFLSAPVTVEAFDEARDLLVKLVSNVHERPDEPKYRRVRPSNAVLSRALFPQAIGVLHLIGFAHEEPSEEWLTLRDDAVPKLPTWLEQLGQARLLHGVPTSLGQSARQMEGAVPQNLLHFSDYSSSLDIWRSRRVCRRWRDECSTALLQWVLLDLPQLVLELNFDGWFRLSSSFTVSDPIAEFQAMLVGNPLTCYAGGAQRLKRPVILDIDTANLEAFRRLNPWEMMKVGRYGMRERPEVPSLEWWAKLHALVATSDLRGRQWEWSERSSTGNSLLYVRHIVYVLARGGTRVTVTMRAIWDSAL